MEPTAGACPVVEDFDNWSPWSSPVISGARLELPSRRYFQMEVTTTTTDWTEMARIDSIQIEFFPLLAPTLVGEVGLPGDQAATLAQVSIGEPTELLYAIGAEFGSDVRDGFDAVRITTPSEPILTRLLVGGTTSDEATEIVPEREPEIDGEGLTLYLDQPVTSDENLWIQFSTSMYNVSTRLTAEVFNRDNVDLRQQVEDGDVTSQISTNRLQVIASGSSISNIIEDLVVEPATITPNGDNVNDNLEISYTLFGVLNAEVQINFYNLAGQQVHSMVVEDQAAGVHSAPAWNGRDQTGQLLDPGLYLCQVTAKTGKGNFDITKPIALAY